MDIAESLGRMTRWGETCDWRGYDPYDALTSPAAGALTLGTAQGRRVLTQVLKRSPVNLRPLLGIERAWNAKAIGLVGTGYARVHAATGDPRARREAVRWLDWLIANPAPDVADGLGWGYHFDVQTRFFFYPARSANTIATSFVAQALLDGAELLGEERFAAAAAEAADYLERTMLREGAAGPYFAYVPDDDQLIHNANVLACAVVARATRDGELVAAALAPTLCAQRPDGSWPYADEGGGWVDNFHTGYVLEGLARCASLVPAAAEPLRRGLAYWADALFLPDGTPKYYPDRTFPLDAQCYAQAIETWLSCRRFDDRAVARAELTARLLVERMLDPRGFAYFQQHRFWTARVPFVRWTTAPSFCALAHLLLVQTEASAARLD